MKSKKYIISILVIVISVIFSTITYAADNSCKLSLNVGKSEVAPGTTVDVTLKISDINAGDGIVTVSGLVEYDETAFEKIEYTACTNWEKTATENYIYINTASLEATKENQDVLKLTLTTKGDVENGTYKVSFKSIDITTDDGVFTVGNIEANVSVKKQSNNGNQGGNKDENQGGNKDENQGGNKDENQDENQDENKDENKDENQGGNKDGNQGGKNTKPLNTSTKILPKTGLTTYLGIIIVIAGIIEIVCYVKYKKYSSIK